MRSTDVSTEQGMGFGGTSSVPKAVFCSRKAVRYRHPLLRVSFTDNEIRYSILPAITMDGIIECTIIEGSFDTGLFFRFIKDLVAKMQPFPGPNSVIVMDNCRIHKAAEIREYIEER